MNPVETLFVPVSSMVGMWIYIGVMLVAVAVAFWIFGHRVEMNLSTMILGFAVYFVFDAVLLNMFFDNLVVGTFSAGLYETVTSSPAAFIPYYAFTRGIFYLLGMYVASRMSMRMDKPGGGVAIGIGFTFGFGMMNQSQGAWTVFQAWRSALAINKAGGTAGYLAQMVSEEVAEDKMQEAMAAAQSLAKTELGYYLVNTIEVLLTLGILFAMAVTIHLAVTRRSPRSHLVIGCVMFVVVMLPTAVFLSGVLESRAIYDLLLALVCGGSIAFAAISAKRYMNNPMQW